jgi:hypothetical protein
MDKGDAFLMGVPGGTKKHLFVIISDINKHNGFGVIVNFSTNKVRSGGECLFARGEHPFLTEPESWVCLGDATPVPPPGWAKIQNGIKNHLVIPQPRMSLACVARIVNAAKISRAFPPVLLKFLD